MYCSKCGAAVVGKFCSCCGTRVRSQIEEYRLAEKRAVKAFEKACTHDENARLLGLDRMHLASACWQAAHFRYRKDHLRSDGSVPAEAFEALDTIRVHAEWLFNQLLDF